MNYTSWIVAISDSFQEKHALAFSLSQSGVGIGIFIFGPLFSFIINSYGWRGAFLITGGCTFQLTFLGALVFPPRPPLPVGQKETDPERLPLSVEIKKQSESEGTTNSTDIIGSEVETKFNTRNSPKRLEYCLWMLHLSSLFWLLATSIPYILLADYTLSLDLEEYAIFYKQILNFSMEPATYYFLLDITSSC